jgi:hypothetical protein
MAYKEFGSPDKHIHENGKIHLVSYHSYICFDKSEIESLPDAESTALGSLALLVPDGVVYSLTADGWKPVGETND